MEVSSVPWQVVPGTAVPAPFQKASPVWLSQGLLQNRLLDKLFAPLGQQWPLNVTGVSREGRKWEPFGAALETRRLGPP